MEIKNMSNTHRDFNRLFNKKARITFDYGYDESDNPITHELPARLSFALEIQLAEYVESLQKKGEDEATIDDLKGMYRLLMGEENFNRLWDLGISHAELEAILNWWQEEMAKLNPKSNTAEETSPNEKAAT
jgi:hypothetical protein